jgi:hypothetical protein
MSQMRMRTRNGIVVALGMLVGCFSVPPPAGADAARPDWSKQPLEGMDRIYPDIEALYIQLHASPELSGVEHQTAATFAGRLRSLGFDVATDVGGTGVVALLRNGQGPTVMLRTELDALPVEEKTGLPYASTAMGVDAGEPVHVMHACGHDIHIAGLVGAATLLAHSKDRWKGTLMEIRPSLGSEDFSEYAKAGVLTFKLYIGAAEPQAFAQAKASGKTLPSNHSSLFAPDRMRTLKTETLSYTSGALELLGRPGRHP